MWTDDVRTQEFGRRMSSIAATLPETVRPS